MQPQQDSDGLNASEKPEKAGHFEPEPVVIPITGELDLHTFAPREVREVLEAYVEACVERGLPSVRIIHGKGTGSLRETVHAWLRKSRYVAKYNACEASEGGWGATRAWLISKRG